MSGDHTRRPTHLGPPERYLIEQWGRMLREAFGRTPYLVGSLARNEPWRDVDVRLILDDHEFDRLTGGDDLRLQALNVAVSIWGQQATGLPIDFQFQPVTAANAESGGQPRHALGILAAARAVRVTTEGEPE